MRVSRRGLADPASLPHRPQHVPMRYRANRLDTHIQYSIFSATRLGWRGRPAAAATAAASNNALLRQLDEAATVLVLATTTLGGLGASRSSPGPTGAYPGPASRGIQFLYPPTVNDHSGPLFTPRHGGTSPRPLPAPLLCRLRIGPAHGSVTLTSLRVPTLTQPPRSTLCRRPGANRPRSEARYTAFGTRPRPRALGRAPPAPSPTKSLA